MSLSLLTFFLAIVTALVVGAGIGIYLWKHTGARKALFEYHNPRTTPYGLHEFRKLFVASTEIVPWANIQKVIENELATQPLPSVLKNATGCVSERFEPHLWEFEKQILTEKLEAADTAEILNSIILSRDHIKRHTLDLCVSELLKRDNVHEHEHCLPVVMEVSAEHGASVTEQLVGENAQVLSTSVLIIVYRHLEGDDAINAVASELETRASIKPTEAAKIFTAFER